MGSVAARELGRRPGSAQGGGTTRARGSDGPRGKWAARPKARKNKISFSFTFSIISKHFQMILKPNLNLNQTTHLKNLNATA
jgi:hypothetical protein